MGTGLVPAGDEGHTGLGDGGKGLGSALHALDARRVTGRAQDDEVIVHDIAAIHTETGSHKGVLKLAGMDHHQVEGAAFRLFQGLAGPGFFHADGDTGLFAEGIGQQRQDTGIHRTDGAGDLQAVRGLDGDGQGEQTQQADQAGHTGKLHGASSR